MIAHAGTSARTDSCVNELHPQLRRCCEMMMESVLSKSCRLLAHLYHQRTSSATLMDDDGEMDLLLRTEQPYVLMSAMHQLRCGSDVYRGCGDVGLTTQIQHVLHDQTWCMTILVELARVLLQRWEGHVLLGNLLRAALDMNEVADDDDDDDYDDAPCTSSSIRASPTSSTFPIRRVRVKSRARIFFGATHHVAAPSPSSSRVVSRTSTLQHTQSGCRHRWFFRDLPDYVVRAAMADYADQHRSTLLLRSCLRRWMEAHGHHLLEHMDLMEEHTTPNEMMFSGIHDTTERMNGVHESAISNISMKEYQPSSVSITPPHHQHDDDDDDDGGGGVAPSTRAAEEKQEASASTTVLTLKDQQSIHTDTKETHNNNNNNTAHVTQNEFIMTKEAHTPAWISLDDALHGTNAPRDDADVGVSALVQMQQRHGRRILRELFVLWRDVRYYRSVAHRYLRVLQNEHQRNDCWMQWRERLRQRNVRRIAHQDDDVRANMFAAQHLHLGAHRMLRWWRDASIATRHLRQVLGRRVLRQWRCEHIAAHHHADILVDAQLILRVFGMWRHKFLERRADDHHHQRQLHQCFRVLQQHAQRQHTQTMAVKHHRLQQQQHILSRWRCRYLRTHQDDVATLHHTRRCYERVWQHWRQRLCDVRHDVVLLQQHRQWIHQKVQEQCFHLWRRRLMWLRMCRLEEQRRREYQQVDVLRRWQHRMEMHQLRRVELNGTADQHYANTLRRRVVRVWIDAHRRCVATLEVKLRDDAMHAAAQHHRQHHLARMFFLWRTRLVLERRRHGVRRTSTAPSGSSASPCAAASTSSSLVAAMNLLRYLRTPRASTVRDALTSMKWADTVAQLQRAADFYRVAHVYGEAPADVDESMEVQQTHDHRHQQHWMRSSNTVGLNHSGID